MRPIVNVPLICNCQIFFIPYNDGDRPVTVTECTTIMPTPLSVCAVLVHAFFFTFI